MRLNAVWKIFTGCVLVLGLAVCWSVDAGAQANAPNAAGRVSLERNMHCGVGTCGRCQLGPWLLCTHGPVLSYEQVDDHWSVRGR